MKNYGHTFYLLGNCLRGLQVTFSLLRGQQQPMLETVQIFEKGGNSVVPKRGGTVSTEEFVGNTLALTKIATNDLGLPFISTQVDRIIDLIARPHAPADFAQAVDVLNDRVGDVLSEVMFIHVPENLAKLYENHSLFGAEVEAKFPSMSEDIAEAGKCLALERSTAAVFHLMRLMEIAVQRLGTELGVSLASEKNWQNVLDETNKAIKVLDHKLSRTKAYAGIASHLYNVKVRWRNEVMHPKQTYTQAEAQEVFSAVQVFIRDLAVVV